MKRLVTALFASLILIAYSCKNSNNDQIKIGTVLCLSNENKLWGNNILKGAKLAISEINEQGGILGKEVILVDNGDSESNPTGAVKAIEKMIADQAIQCIIGDAMSSNTLAIAPIAEKNKRVLLNFCVAIELTDAGDYIFRNWNSAISDAKSTSDIAKTLSSKIIVLFQNDSYGISLKDEFTRLVESDSVEIIYTEAFNRKSTDFRTLISKIKSIDYDGIYIASYFSEAMNFLKQYDELNGKIIPFYGTSEWEEPNLIALGKRLFPNQLYYGYPKPPDSTSVVRQEFLKNYTSTYKEEPGILCDNGYDAIYQLKYGIENAGIYDATMIKDALYTMQNFHGASGLMSFDENGDVNKPFGIRIITDDGAAWLD